MLTAHHSSFLQGSFACRTYNCTDWNYCRSQWEPTVDGESVLQAVSSEGLVHFDLKCDNVFVQQLPGVSEQDFWSPVDDAPPFHVVLGDFGDSHDFRQAGCHPISL